MPARERVSLGGHPNGTGGCSSAQVEKQHHLWIARFLLSEASAKHWILTLPKGVPRIFVFPCTMSNSVPLNAPHDIHPTQASDRQFPSGFWRRPWRSARKGRAPD